MTPFAMANNFAAARLEECAGQRENMFLWAPVFLSLGIGAYFALPFEPDTWTSALALAASFSPLLLLRKFPAASWMALALFLVALGFTAAQMRSHLVYTPILAKKLGPVQVTGTIEAVEELEEAKGRRLLLYDLEIEKLPPERTPVKARLTIRNKGDFASGQRVRLLAQLNPPSPPVAPGAFDFQRYMYFERIGAVGFIYRKEETLAAAQGRTRNFIEELRDKIALRVKSIVASGEAPLTTAFVTGQRSAISKDDNAAMRDSGLAHLISISGIHIGLFSAFVFFVSRLAMACIPGWALKRPIKKYAAALGFIAAAFYTVLAGASIPTQRSLIMAGMVYVAIILDRSPISLRLLAAAAMAVLLIAPESLLSASFQMSFGAVTALVAFFDRTRGYWTDLYARAGFFRRAGLYFAGACLSSLVASLATAPFSLFHFQQFALYSLPANLAAAPLTSFLIMPAVVLSLFLMPIGLDWLPLKGLEHGMRALLWIAHEAADMPGAVLHLPAWPQSALILFSCGAVFMLLWRGWLRFLGMAPLIAALLVIVHYRQPDILVSQDFSLMAFRTDDGGMSVSGRRKNKFALESWERMAGLEQGAATLWPKEGREGPMICDENACRLEMKGRKISFLKEPESATDECAWADFVLSFGVVEEECHYGDGVNFLRPLFRDKFDGIRNGAHAAWITPKGIAVRNVEEERGERLWSGGND